MSSARTSAPLDLPTSGPPAGSYRQIFSVAGPLMLSSTGMMLMQFVDALFLAWHSQTAVAAVVPAGATGWLLISPFLGVAMYTQTFVAQYAGAGQRERATAAVWQGVWFSLGTGLVVVAMGCLAEPLFLALGHEAPLRGLEAEYLRISLWCGPAMLLAAALTGFFAGRGDTRTVMVVHLLGFLVNGLLDWMLIFGRWGAPEMGIGGAAWATGAGQAVTALALGGLFLLPAARQEYGTWRARGFDAGLMRRLIAFGFPSALRLCVEMIGWTFFLLFIGRLGEDAMAVSSIAFRVNGIVFFPLVGFAQAIAILVGQAQGAQRPDLSARTTWRGLLLGEVWMMTGAASFVLFPEIILGLFHDPRTQSPEQFQALLEAGVPILRLVALYSLLDGLNIILVHALQGAGDTRWTFAVTIGVYGVFFASLYGLDAAGGGVYGFWVAATACVMAQALVWLLRFTGGRWRRMQVIEAVPQPG